MPATRPAVPRRTPRPFARLRAAAGLLAGLLALAGCGAGGDDATRAARDRAAARAGWTLELEDAGATHAAALERMDVFVAEDEGASEIFELRGAGVVLVGEIPADLAVGYEEAFERLVGRELVVAASGGDPRAPKTSSVTLGGVAAPVAGGTLRVEKVTGRWDGAEGDRTLHGTLELRVPSAGGERTVRGRFAVHVVTWG
uniref:YceI family protein n=1 Tax=Eiseniibacteriota bacterium TaxID=2212470 RepID=A0A832MKV1_UNCEI